MKRTSTRKPYRAQGVIPIRPEPEKFEIGTYSKKLAITLGLLAGVGALGLVVVLTYILTKWWS